MYRYFNDMSENLTLENFEFDKIYLKIIIYMVIASEKINK